MLKLYFLLLYMPVYGNELSVFESKYDIVKVFEKVFETFFK